MKRRYLRLVRRAYRYLRHPRIRKRPWLVALIKPLYERELWHPCRKTIAGGVSVGLFFAMLPIPMQMLFSAIACMRLRVNVPIAMATCWISNPLTHPPLILLQISFGNWIRQYVEIKLPFDKEAHFRFMEIDFTGNPADFFVGCLTMALLVSLVVYPIVYGLSTLLPNRGRRMTAEDRRKKSHSQDPKSTG